MLVGLWAGLRDAVLRVAEKLDEITPPSSP